MLDRPHLPSQIAVQDITYKVMVVGKTGVGKTSTVARLAGTEIPQVHNETPGKFKENHSFTSVYYCCLN